MTYHGIQNGQKRVLHVKQRNIPGVRVWFVECRDTLMQILVSLDRDKHSSVSVASGFSCVAMRREWLTVGLCFAMKITSRACKSGETYGWTLFCYEDHQAGEWGETYGQTYFIFLFYFDDQLDLPVKETDRLYWCVRVVCLRQAGNEP